MLLTTCPNCSAQFRVQPEQLNVRQGRVMCGRCRQVFNAFQSLTRVEDPPEELAVMPVHSPAPAAPISSASTVHVDESETVDPLLLHEESEPSSRLLPPVAARAVADVSIDTSASAAAHPAAESDEDLSFGLSNRSAPPVTMTSAEMNAGVADALPSETSLADNPLLVKSGPYRTIRRSHVGWWASGAILLALGLALQATYAYRSLLAQNFPEARPLLAKACEWASCTLHWARDEAAIKIEASDLVETPGTVGRIQLTATLANRGRAQQDFPALELRLTDNGNQVVLSRVLTPAEYLGRAPGKDEGIAPGGEVYVNLHMQLATKLPASGYGVRAFYPART